jgi:hypothetical protein
LRRMWKGNAGSRPRHGKKDRINKESKSEEKPTMEGPLHHKVVIEQDE